MHCYVHTHHLAKYQYILTNNKTRFGDFHALMPALFGKAAHDPDAHLKALKNEAKRSWTCNPKPNGQGSGLLSKTTEQRCLKWRLQEATKRSGR
jgi:hypothetical protein